MPAKKVDVLSETWQAVLCEIDKQLESLRKSREDFSTNSRVLDFELGAIKRLEDLKRLPERQAKKPPEPLRGSGVRVPGMSHSIDNRKNG